MAFAQSDNGYLPTRSQAPSVQFGQGFQDIAPSLPTSKPGAVQTIPKVEQPQGSSRARESVITAELKGLVFVEKEDEIKAEGVPGVSGVIASSDLLKKPEFATKMQRFFGKPVTLGGLDEITKEVINYFREQGFPVVNVVVPQQNVKDGVIQILAIEAKVGRVKVEGARWFRPDNIRAEVKLREGDKIDANQLQDDVGWLNTNPFRTCDLIFEPGTEEGTTDLVIQTKDRLPLRLYTTFDDYGIDLTGKNRQSLGFNVGNLFSLDQQAGFQYTTAWKDVFNSMNAYSGSYSIPFPWRNSMTLYGSYTKSDAVLAANQSLQGDSWQISERYNVPLPTFGPLSHSLFAGTDFKQSINALTIFGTNIGSGINSGLAPFSIFQLTAGYDATVQDDWGLTSGEAAVYYSPGGVSGWNNQKQFNQVILNANDNYVYGKFNFNRTFILPYKFTISGNFNAQLASTPMMPTEQYGIGGYNTVRGYDERSANGDQGYLMNVELRTPPGSIFKMFGNQTVDDSFQFIGFFDYGYVEDIQAPAGSLEQTVFLMSVGPGLRYNIDRFVSVRFDWGFQLHQAPIGSVTGSRAELSATVAY
jgi:hemolysin activation/secretion protein